MCSTVQQGTILSCYGLALETLPLPNFFLNSGTADDLVSEVEQIPPSVPQSFSFWILNIALGWDTVVSVCMLLPFYIATVYKFQVGSYAGLQ